MKSALFLSLLVGFGSAVACGGKASSNETPNPCAGANGGACLDPPSDAGPDAPSDSGACTNVPACPTLPLPSGCNYAPATCVDGVNTCGQVVCADASTDDASTEDASVSDASTCGTGCCYADIAGTFTVTSIVDAPSGAATCGASPKEVTLSFTPAAGSPDAGTLVTAPGHLYFESGSSEEDLPAVCLTSLGVTVGHAIQGTRKVETSGTCDPVIDTVTIDLSSCGCH